MSNALELDPTSMRPFLDRILITRTPQFLNLYHSILIDADSAATIHSHLHDILVYSIPHLTVISTGTQELQTRFTSLVWRLLAALKIDPYYTACPKCLSLRCKLSKILLQLRHQYLLDPVLHGCAKEAIFGDRDDAFAKVRFSESGMPESVVIDNKAWGMQDDDWGNEERDEEGEESQEIEVVWVDGEKDFVSCGIIEMDARRSMEHQVEEIGDMEERIQNADELLARVEKFQNDLLGYEPTIEETREAMDGL